MEKEVQPACRKTQVRGANGCGGEGGRGRKKEADAWFSFSGVALLAENQDFPMRMQEFRGRGWKDIG